MIERRMIESFMEVGTIILLCSSLFISSTAADTITANQTIRDGDTLVSAGGEFEMGFFSPVRSTNRYFGIWYKKISYGTVIWVANRETPLTNTSGVVGVSNKGIIVVANGSASIIWSSNSSRSVKNPVAQILDTGNLVFRDENESGPENLVWQSFDHPVDNFLPGMKFGVDLVTGMNRYFTSWKSVDDPSPGSFIHRLDTNGFPQLLLWKGSAVWYRTGPWVGSRFSGIPNLKPNGIYTPDFVITQKEIYYKFDLVNSSASAITRLALTPDGDSQRLIWNERNQEWMVYLTLQVSDCDRYGLCGAYGSCNINNSPRCECLRGFDPKVPANWAEADWSDGCVRNTQLDCGIGEGFVKYSGVKLPDTRHSWYNMSMNLEECERVCLKNCSCTAYSNTDIRGSGSGCLLWFGELTDIRGYSEDGQDLYVRMAASELGGHNNSKVKKRLRIILIPVLLAVTILLGLFLLHVFKNRKLNREGTLGLNSESHATNRNEREGLDLPLFEFIKIVNATNNFSYNNKLGEGGFGPVYKCVKPNTYLTPLHSCLYQIFSRGTNDIVVWQVEELTRVFGGRLYLLGILEEGQEIAVKRLSKNSRQGVDEFKNEVLCIAELQHRNLVKLLGCCIEEEERMLIYEYMPNKSLDFFIFDEKVSNSFHWPKRYNIIKGIARGLLYLHQDSRLRIIHRDLKVSNILLDYEMNPKISDFGMARSFGGSETEANTTRVVGTYGYMPPEYAIDGQFSVKSDVYSFGVLVLETVSGKRNRGFHHSDHNLNLLGHVWRSYNEGNLLEVIDGTILKSSNQDEVFRVIHIGLLCVQQYPDDRPSMSSVVLMLSSIIPLPPPKQPGFFSERKPHETDSSSSNLGSSTLNEYSVTFFAPR